MTGALLERTQTLGALFPFWIRYRVFNINCLQVSRLPTLNTLALGT